MIVDEKKQIMKKQVPKSSKKTASKKSATAHAFPIVGIGASAGGLDAFMKVLSKIPADINMAFVLVQHLDPSHPSLSVDIISRSTKLKIEEAKNGTRLQPGHIYVNPPNYSMSISEGILILSLRDEASAPHMTINYFFQSLASSEKKRAIGVILSGTGTDGTTGLWNIKAEGGITYAQLPSSTKYSAMPESAIASGVVDLVLRPEDIAKDLIHISSNIHLKPRQESAAFEDPKSEQILNQIFNLVHIHKKVDFSGYKHTTIKRRIERRMLIHKSKSLKDYADYLRKNIEEIQALYDDFLINVTEFFRDPESFKLLKKRVFPALLKNKDAGVPFRIWVPGCSTGEEAYSIAILLLELLQAAGKHNQIQIFATDICEPALQKARSGFYSENISENVSKDRLEKFFDKVEGGYKISKRVRDLCLFSKHDVTGDPPFSKLDIISCRNLLIYFSAPLQKRIIPVFHYALNNGGFLVLGKSEGPGDFSKLFNLVEETHKIYSKTEIPTPTKFLFRPFSRESSAKSFEILPKTAADYHKEVDKLLLSRFAPPGVLVNADFEILQFRGRTAPFIEPAAGQPSLNLFKMARPQLLPSLRKGIQSVKKDHKPWIQEGLSFEIDNHRISLDIEVLPTNPNLSEKQGLFLVLFKETAQRIKSTKKTQKGSVKGRSSKDQEIVELLNELNEVKDYHETLIGQYESSQEELTAANEKLQSANEELQSANEELETSQEELQSTNEELVTVNDELQIRNSDLSVLSNDLNNILTSIEIPVLLVGSNSCVRMFSPKAKDMFNLIHTDIGRPISDIRSNFNLDVSAFTHEVFKSLKLKEIEIQDINGQWWRIQVRPYKTSDDRMDGVVISFVDIHLLKQEELKTKEMLEYLTSVSEAMPLPLVVINQNFQFESANRSFYKYFQVSETALGKYFFADLKINDLDIKKLKESVLLSISENKTFSDIEIECEVPILGRRILLCGGGKINSSLMKLKASLVSFIDITDQRRFDEERKHLLKQEQEARRLADNANRAKDIFLATVTHELRTPLTSILSWAQLIVS